MALRTLLQLRTQARQLADMVNSTFVTDTELTSYINLSTAKLHSMQAESGEKYDIKSKTFNTVVNTDTYALEADFYKLDGDPEILVPGTVPARYQSMKFFEFKERNRFRSPYLLYDYRCNYHYSIWGVNLVIAPVPSEILTIRYWYEPVFTYFTADGDTYNFLDGWEAYVVYDTAIMMMEKEESDTRSLTRRFEQLQRDITESIQKRITGPRHVVEVDRADDEFTWAGHAIF